VPNVKISDIGENVQGRVFVEERRRGGRKQKGQPKLEDIAIPAF
jgi:hypothetical protein